MILPSNLIDLNGINKLWRFEVEGSQWPKRQYHTLRAFRLWHHLIVKKKTLGDLNLVPCLLHALPQPKNTFTILP